MRLGVGLGAYLLLNAALAFGQSAGSVSGIVLDPESHVIANAHVECISLSTGAKVVGETSPSGLFVFPSLPIGSYGVIVTAPSFGKLTEQPVEVLTGRTLNLELHLKVGDKQEVVEVSAATPLIQTSSSHVESTVEGAQIRDLPLNGRNAIQLVVLTPGAVLTTAGTNAGQQDNTGVAVNGLRATDNNYTLDGASYTNRNFDSAPTLPNPDTLEEFTVQSANFGAQNPGAGAFVQLSTRSGANAVHGTAFEFLRNDVMDARNYFNTTKLPFKLNQYGGTIGGPIKRDKSFFFGSYQGSNQRGNPTPKTLTVPTAAERAGDFSASSRIIIDPATGLPFQGNKITNIDPLGAKLAALIPAANNNGLLVVAPNSNVDDKQFLAKVDQLIGDKHTLSARYFWDHYNFQRDTGSIPGIYAYNTFDNQSAVLRDTYTVTPKTVLTGLVSYSRNFRTQSITTPTTVQALGANVPLASSIAQPEIRVYITGYLNLFGGGPLVYNPQSWEAKFEVDHTVAQHFLQAGVTFQRTREYARDVSNGSGTWNFTGQRTSSTSVSNSGDGFADMLLGLPNTFVQAASEAQNLLEYSWSVWGQDNWHIARNLTLNLGVRWDPWLPAHDSLGQLPGFLPGVQSQVAADAPLGLIFSGDPGIPDSVVGTRRNNVAPRIGFAWNVFGNGSMSIRGAYGIFYRTPPLNVQRYTASTAAFRGLQVQVNSPTSASDPYASYAGGTPFPFIPLSTSELHDYTFPSNVTSSVLNPNSKTGTTQSWNLFLDRELTRSIALSIGYVGNRSIHIMGATEANPGVYSSTATIGNINTRRLYTGLGATTFLTPYMYENYNALQVSVSRRSTNGLFLSANYVYSKTLDNDSASSLGALDIINPFDTTFGYGPADFDQAHRLNASIVYPIPALTTSHRWVGAITHDWQVNSIVVLQSGLPFSVKSGLDRSFSGVGNDLADKIGNAARPSGVSAVSKWFNTAAFAQNALGTFGNSGRNALRGPGYVDVDFSLFRTFPLVEHTNLQLRGEAFNLFNHANFNAPVSTLSSSTFGRITSANSPRVMQVSAKIMF